MDNKEPKMEFPFAGMRPGNRHLKNPVRYPCYLYREDTAPLLVKDTSEEADARADGYDSVTAASMANKQLINWYWDLEDMSPRQLVVFAQDEYGVDLPVEAGQERLFQAVLELTRSAPQNRNRLVLMAHTMQMNYDATQEEIRRMMSGSGQHLEIETITEEVWL